MTPKTELELQGNFLSHPFAELFAEIASARLSGSLRISDKDRKCIFYFKGGRLVFAVSNSRQFRLFEILLKRKRLTAADLTQIPNFSNDFEFTAFLQDKNSLTKEECDGMFTEQIEGIVVDALLWQNGDWSFSPLARVRDGLDFSIDTPRLFVDYARCMPSDTVLGRFRSLDESFYRSERMIDGLSLRSSESFLLEQIADTPLTASELIVISAMSESNALHAIYTLWLGGLLIRCDWQSAFSEGRAAAMREAKLSRKSEAKVPSIQLSTTNTIKLEIDPTSPNEPEITITLEKYLERVESADTYYDILGVDVTADSEELKRAYFGLARSFHPDHFHVEGGETLQRIQHAFTLLAQAHETLKDPANREMYDYRMRKELVESKKPQNTTNKEDHGVQAEQADENFERGFSLLMNNEIEASLPFLTRAVHYAPNNARYHAYYGKALSFDESKRHKAEAEIQTAIKLDANSPTFRILLAEFFIQQNLLKRAEGELNRLLAVFPDNREAEDLLAKLKVNA